METEELTKLVDGIYKNILDKFNPGARQMITAGKAYLKSLHGAAAASKLYVDAIGKLGRQAQQGTWGGSADIGTALMKVVEVYREIQDQQMNILKAFYVDLLVPLETNLEKDTKVIQSEQKRFMQQHKLRSESYSKAAAAIKKQRKKNTRNASKAGTAMDKELKTMQVLEEEKTKMDAFCEQSLKNAMTQERRRYGFVLERQCSLAKHWLAYHGGGAASYQAGLEEWQDVARTREFLPPTVESMFVSRMRQVSFWSDDEEGIAGDRGEESVYACPGAALRKARSVDASCLDVRSIGALANDEIGSEMGLARAKSDFDLHDTSTHAMQQESHLTPNRRPNSFAPPPPQPAAWEAPLARALYAYISSGDNQLSFLEGDLVALHGDRTKGWQYGENLRTQQAGWFPLAYTEIITDEIVGSPARWGSSQGAPPQTPVPSVTSTPIAAASNAPTSHATNVADVGVLGLGLLADDSRTARMFGDTLVAHRNAKQMRRVTGSSSGHPGPGPPPTLPAPVPAPSVPAKLPHSQSASFHSPSPASAHPGKAATMKTSASSANFVTREETKNSFGPQTLPMRGQVGVTKGTPKGAGVAAVGNVSLHSSNDSGFSNEPPPQPEIDYSDEETQHRNRMPIRNGQRTQDEARFMKTQSLRRDSKLNGTREGRDRKPQLTDDQQMMLRTMLEMDKDSHKVKRTKSFWKFGRTTSQDVMEGMSLWQHRDLVDTVPEFKKKFYAKIQEAILSTQIEASENGYNSSDSTLKNGESSYLREQPSQTIDRREIHKNVNGIRQSKSLSSIQNANIANKERERNNSPMKESSTRYKKKSVSDKSISKENEEEYNSRHDRQSNDSDFTNASTIKTNFENSFYDDENGGGLMVKTVKRQEILQRYDNNTSESDNNSVSSSTDPYDCIIVDDHMTTTGRKHKEIELQRKGQKVSTEHATPKQNPHMYAPDVDESEICLIKPQVRATLSSDRKKSGKISQHEPQPHQRAIETFKTFKDNESDLKSLSESAETLKYIEREEVDENYFDNSHETLPLRRDHKGRTRKEDKTNVGNGDDTLTYNKDKGDKRVYRTKESEQIKYRETPGRNIDSTKSTQRERSHSDYYRGPDGDTLKYNGEKTRREEKYYSTHETDSKKAAKSKRYYDHQEEEHRRLFMEQQAFMRSNGEGTKYNASEQSDDQKYDEAMRQQKPQLLPRTKLLKTNSAGTSAGSGGGATMQTVMKFEQEIGLMSQAQSKRELAAAELRDLAAAELRDLAAAELSGSGHTFGPWYDLWGIEGGQHHK